MNFIKENKVVYQVSAKPPGLMQSYQKYHALQEKIIYPILRRFAVQESQQKYVAAYYINGIYAIIDEWIKGGCQDDINLILKIIIGCVTPFETEHGNHSKN